MSHSIAFSIISTVVLMLVFRKNNYRLGAIVATSTLTHISYDVFDGEFGFPVLTPLANKIIQFPKTDWLVFEIVAVAIIVVVSFLAPRKEFTKKQILT
jgi:hypothetical protein